MSGGLFLERDEPLRVLTEALDAALTGHGSTVLVTGEAGIGKTGVIRRFQAAARGRIRVLAGACDDLLTARPLGPLRDAAAHTSGPLAAALRDGPAETLPAAATAEFAGGAAAALLVEDLHWADEATLDLLGYLGRRSSTMPLLLVLTYRDDAVTVDHPVQRLLGALAGTSVHRVALAPLSVSAVQLLAAGTNWDPERLHRLTGGNPFHLTETLAAPGSEVPVTVSDAVLARHRLLGEACRRAVEQLCVVPTVVGFALAESLLPGRLGALAEAEERGILEVRPDGLAFRHELARRAVERSLPRLTRRALHATVVAALREQPTPDPARLVHHGVRAGDRETVARFAPQAGREAAAAGSHREALAHFAVAQRYVDLLSPPEQAAVADDHAWELYNARHFALAAEAGERAVALHRALGDPVALGEALVRLSRHRFMTGDTRGAEQACQEALELLERRGPPSSLAYAVTYRGSLLALGPRPTDAWPVLRRAQELARDAARPDLVALTLNYQSLAEPGLDEEGRLTLLRRSLDLALHQGFHEIAARGYTNLAELLYRYHRLDELALCVAQGLSFAAEHGFWSHSYNLEVHRCLLALRRGSWSQAERGLADLVARDPDPGMLAVYSLPSYGRLLARRGSAEAEPMLRAAWDRAQRQRLLLGLGFAATALVEWAWLEGRPDVVRDVIRAWPPEAIGIGAEGVRAELVRYASRAGVLPDSAEQATVFDGCPQPWAAGLHGDWAAAAQGWHLIGDPYEEALELAESGEVGPTLEALRQLEDLGAAPAAAMVRRRLRELGVRRRPRGPDRVTRSNPAGLTGRQVDVLVLLAQGLTNAEIADRLVLSVRTVDSHVGAVLDKLGVASRAQAAETARSWGITD